MAHEQRMDEQGLDMAQRLINSETPEDVKNLNALDAAQTYGYMSVVDNPYFKAYAEKLRGSYLSTVAKREYDEKYANTPAKSLEDEQKRYTEFMHNYRQESDKEHEPSNRVSFNMGWSDGVFTNGALVANNYVSKEIDTDAKITYAESKAQLGQLVQNSFEVLKTPNLMTDSANKIFANTKLMGLDPQLRTQLASDFVLQMVSTGHMTWQQMEPMLKGVKIGTRMNGEQESLYDVLDPQGVKSAAFNYRKQFLTKFQYDFVQKYAKASNPDKAWKEIADYRNNGKYEEADLLASQMPSVISAQEAEKNRKAAAAAAAAARSLKEVASASELRKDFESWMNNGTTFNISRLSQDDLDSFFQENLKYYTQKGLMRDKTQMEYLAKALRYPKFSRQLANFKDSASMDLDNVMPDGDGNVVLSGTADALLTFYENSPQNFNAILGSDLNSRMSVLHTLRVAFGDEVGLQRFAQYNALPKDEREEYMNRAEKSIVDGMMNVEGMHSLGGGDTATVYFQNSNELMRAGRSIYGALMAAGIDSDTAIRKTMNSIQESFAYYHGAIIPRGAFNNLGTPQGNDEAYGEKALSTVVYSYAEKYGLSPESVSVDYDSRTQIFTFSGGDTEMTFELDMMRESALWLAQKDADGQSAPEPQQTNINEVNAARANNDNVMDTPGQDYHSGGLGNEDGSEYAAGQSTWDSYKRAAGNAWKTIKGVFSK